ncbi:hypothetical protein PG991_012103 [Apiospora marii]|uniref:Myosin tail domain-containing protein n=1 Tax=Apiospora marii TaxID=335849 RepID=A0ABR1RG03_9PEZI
MAFVDREIENAKNTAKKKAERFATFQKTVERVNCESEQKLKAKDEEMKAKDRLLNEAKNENSRLQGEVSRLQGNNDSRLQEAEKRIEQLEEENRRLQGVEEDFFKPKKTHSKYKDDVAKAKSALPE